MFNSVFNFAFIRRCQPVNAVVAFAVLITAFVLFTVAGGLGLQAAAQTTDAETSAPKTKQQYYDISLDGLGFMIKIPTTWNEPTPAPDNQQKKYLFKSTRTLKAKNGSTTDTKLTVRYITLKKLMGNEAAPFRKIQKKIRNKFTKQYPDNFYEVERNTKEVYLYTDLDESSTEPYVMQVAFVGNKQVMYLDFEVPANVGDTNLISDELYAIANNSHYLDGWGVNKTKLVPDSADDRDMPVWLELLLNLLALFIQFISVFVLLIVGYFIGRHNEKKHFEFIKKREAQYAHVQVTNAKIKHFLSVEEHLNIVDAQLVCGSIVISEDYFKRIVGALRCFFGGNIATYESLLDRARREAVLRLLEQVPQANMITNLRLETSSISKGRVNKNSVTSIEILAYGTALRFGNQSSHHDQLSYDTMEANHEVHSA